MASYNKNPNPNGSWSGASYSAPNGTPTKFDLGPLSNEFNIISQNPAGNGQHERLGYSYTTFERTMDYFDISGLPDYDNMAEPYIGYVFMSRPNLYINRKMGVDWGYPSADTTAMNNWSTFASHPMTAAYTMDRYGDQMLRALSYCNPNGWLPIITTRCKNYTVPDMEIKTIEKSTTYFGHKIVYGKHSEDHKIGGSITLSFRNDRYLSILKMMHLWMCYISMVSKYDIVEPNFSDQYNGILDYASSIYFLVTRRDGRELVYWEKLVGVFPTRLPFSIFSREDTPDLEDTISIDFTYGIRCDPCDPNILMDINVLSGDLWQDIDRKSKNGWKDIGRSKPDYLNSLMVDKTGKDTGDGNNTHELDNLVPLTKYDVPFTKGNIYASHPYITMRRDNGLLKYYLCWEGKKNG